jgi:hypothetical protein
MWLKIILPVVLILGVLFFIGARVLTSPKTDGFPDITSSLQPELAADDDLEARISVLEQSLTNLSSELVSGSPTPSTRPSSLDTRVKSLETQLSQLNSRVAALEISDKSSTQVNSGENVTYIPLGPGSSSSALDWTTVSLPEFTIDPADFSGYTNMYLEVNLRSYQGNGRAYARVINSTDGTAILGSEVSTTSEDYVTVTSGAFKVASTKKTYKMQLKTLTSYEASVQFARIKVVY